MQLASQKEDRLCQHTSCDLYSKTLRTFLVGFSSFLLLLVAPGISSRTFLASVVTDSSSELSLSDSSSSSVEENRLAPDFLEEAESLLPFSGSPLLPGVPEQEEKTNIIQYVYF